MNDTAVHLVDHVLYFDTPIRQWVCSMPFSLRYLMGYDKKACADILSVYGLLPGLCAGHRRVVITSKPSYLEGDNHPTAAIQQHRARTSGGSTRVRIRLETGDWSY